MMNQKCTPLGFVNLPVPGTSTCGFTNATVSGTTTFVIPSKPAVTPAQLQWLHENPQYHVVAEGREYTDTGLLTAAGHYYGGAFKVPPPKSIVVGIRLMTNREYLTRYERERRAKINADPERRERPVMSAIY
jgi:hypothetical protein